MLITHSGNRSQSLGIFLCQSLEPVSAGSFEDDKMTPACAVGCDTGEPLRAQEVRFSRNGQSAGLPCVPQGIHDRQGTSVTGAPSAGSVEMSETHRELTSNCAHLSFLPHLGSCQILLSTSLSH